MARHYYIDNLSQNEIAQKAGISRSKVSRLLERARELGIVTIDIRVPASTAVETLEEKLSELLPLEKVIVVPASVSESTPETQEQLTMDVASVAAAYLPKMLSGKTYVGVGWGRTVYNIPPYLPIMSPMPDMTFLPMVSNMTFRNRYLQTSHNVSRFADKFGAETYYLNLSGFRRPNEPLNEAELYNVRQIEEYWEKLEAAIFSVGTPPLTDLCYMMDTIDPAQFTVTDSDPDGRGEILAQVYFSDGRPACHIGEGVVSMVSMPLERLRTIPVTICVAAGTYKAEPVYYAVMNGYVKTLIIDHLLAEAILKVADEKRKKIDRKIRLQPEART